MKKLILFSAFALVAYAQANGLITGKREICTNNDICYFIRQGYVYTHHKAAQRAQIMRGSRHVKGLVIYANRLVALQHGGEAWMWAADRNAESPYWVNIADDAQQIYADGDYLYFISNNGELFLHDFNLTITWTRMPMPPMPPTSLSGFNRYIGFAENVFFDSGHSNVERLEELDGSRFVVYKDGKTTRL